MASRNTTKKRSPAKKKTTKAPANEFREEIIILISFAVCVLCLISNFGIGGFVGERISAFQFGLFGLIAYVVPILVFVGIAFIVSNRSNGKAYIKTGAGVVLIFMLCTLIQLFMHAYDKEMTLSQYFIRAGIEDHAGGLASGIIMKALCPAIGVAGTLVVVIILAIICIVLITEKSFLKGVKSGGKKAYTSAREDVKRRQEQAALNRERRRQEQEQNQNALSGVSFDTTLGKKPKTPEIKELKPPKEKEVLKKTVSSKPDMPEAGAIFDMPEAIEEPGFEINRAVPEVVQNIDEPEVPMEILQEPMEAAEFVPISAKQRKTKESAQTVAVEAAVVQDQIKEQDTKQKKQYRFPPAALLMKGTKSGGDSDLQLKETAHKLQQTLQNFGVNVTITNVSCGPSVTRYELQPEQGVKVSRIVGLTDDIKLNLAAADIRIEAPIPGKAAVGIEVPNQENTAVMLRDLLDSTEFKNSKSNISFAVGRDIAGKAVVADIKKMPHVLIAGATGSGKSVCINTLVISILYKAHPDDVKLIMIDPKVVELSVYNGIPHLLIPVVTDPKKAAGALNWAVAEMTKRYQLFAEYNVRDLYGFNEKVKSIEDIEDEDKPKKMPQIVIIVDELADLMMVAPGEVEEAICRLAQLARAAGIHLVLATQRPSVNVITGLIKANMPSRIAFSVSSGVDSRTIIDMNGAEKLLGKGDMLFYPSGYQKPVRVQGSFVSDKEVQSVVEFLVNHNENSSYDESVAQHVNTNAGNGGAAAGGTSGSDNGRDVYFVDAGKFIIEKDKASIGMLQRVFKIGFNRAARIMDQLAEAGIVGEEEGTKPRKVLMSIEEFEQYIEEYV